jgi:hypothetical protein
VVLGGVVQIYGDALEKELWAEAQLNVHKHIEDREVGPA